MAKERGFDEQTWDYYTKSDNLLGSPFDNGPGYFNSDSDFPGCKAAPTQSLLAKWLREKQIDITVITNWGKKGRTYGVGFSYVNPDNEVDIWFYKKDGHPSDLPTYEEAMELGLSRALIRLAKP